MGAGTLIWLTILPSARWSKTHSRWTGSMRAIWMHRAAVSPSVRIKRSGSRLARRLTRLLSVPMAQALRAARR